MKSEIVFTATNRPHYLEESINSWNGARGLSDWQATFFVEPSPIREHVIERAFNLSTTTTVVLNESRLGVLVNPWTALNTKFEEGADFVILAEDDVVVSSDILEYFQWTSEEYSGVKKILCINAFSQIGGGKQNQIVQDQRFSPLVWGIWRDRWEEHLRATWDKDYSSGNADGSEAGWDWNINRILQNKDMRILKPLQSRSDHIGELGGAHMTPDLFPSSRGVDFVQARGRSRYNEI